MSLRPWPQWAALWLLLFITALALGPWLSAEFLGHLNAHGHRHLHAHGHPFIDARPWLGIPNAADVLSNLPFALIALWGWLGARRRSAALQVFLLGLLGTALGSGIYHAWPSALTLTLDRGGMALAFAGLLALAVDDRLSPAAARSVLWVLTPAALLAAALPLSGNLLPWAVVQFGGVLALLMLALRPVRTGAAGLPLVGIVALYALAKVCEGADAAIFAATGEGVSGHTLKHLVAAGAAALGLRGH